MYSTGVGLGRDALLDALADWSGRIAAGEAPEAPPRPKGIERNIVITQWDWGDKFTYAHDEVATDKRQPAAQRRTGRSGASTSATTACCGSTRSRTRRRAIKIPTRGGFNTPWCDQTAAHGLGRAASGRSAAPPPRWAASSAYLGEYQNPANPHNPMMDGKGKRLDHHPDPARVARGHPGVLPAPTPCIADGPPPPAARLLRPQDEEVPAHRHLLRHAPPAVRQEGRAVVERRLVRARLVRPGQVRPGAARDARRRAQGWSRDEGRHERRRRGRQARPPASTTGSSRTTRTAASGRRRAQRRPAGHILRYDPATRQVRAYYPPPAPGYGPRGVDVDSKGDHLDRPRRQRPPGQLRPLQVHARPGATATSAPRAGRSTEPRPARSETGAGPENETSADFHYYIWVNKYNTLGHGQGHGDPQRHRLRLAAGLQPEDEEVHGHPGPVPAERLHARARRPHRRPEGRLEGPRPVVRQRHSTPSSTTRSSSG